MSRHERESTFLFGKTFISKANWLYEMKMFPFNFTTAVQTNWFFRGKHANVDNIFIFSAFNNYTKLIIIKIVVPWLRSC